MADSSTPTVSLRHDVPATQYIVGVPAAPGAKEGEESEWAAAAVDAAPADAAMSNGGTAEANTEEVAARCGTIFSDMVLSLMIFNEFSYSCGACTVPDDCPNSTGY
jgi:hypothetical protein